MKLCFWGPELWIFSLSMAQLKVCRWTLSPRPLREFISVLLTISIHWSESRPRMLSTASWDIRMPKIWSDHCSKTSWLFTYNFWKSTILNLWSTLYKVSSKGSPTWSVPSPLTWANTWPNFLSKCSTKMHNFALMTITMVRLSWLLLDVSRLSLRSSMLLSVKKALSLWKVKLSTFVNLSSLPNPLTTLRTFWFFLILTCTKLRPLPQPSGSITKSSFTTLSAFQKLCGIIFRTFLFQRNKKKFSKTLRIHKTSKWWSNRCQCWEILSVKVQPQSLTTSMRSSKTCLTYCFTW